jgi:hypothetical protein
VIRTTVTLLALVIVVAPAFAGPVSTRVGLDFASYSFETYTGDVEVSETLVPIDLLGNAGATDWNLGVDLASAEAQDWTGDGSLSGPSQLRAGLSREFVDGRLQVSADAGFALTKGPYSSDERLLLGWISRHELNLPAPLFGQGNRYGADASFLLVSTKRAAVFLGGFVEIQNAFEFRDDGLELDPSDLLGAGVGLERGWNRASARLQLFYEHPLDGRIDGADAYALGDRYRLGAEFVTPFGSGRADGSAELLSVEDGEILPGWVLESSWIRGGNRLLWAFSWEKEAPAFWGLGLGGRHHRGFSGALGHSDWLVPQVVLGRHFGNGDVRLRTEYRVGSVREGRSLQGFAGTLSWSREWIR